MGLLVSLLVASIPPLPLPPAQALAPSRAAAVAGPVAPVVVAPAASAAPDDPVPVDSAPVPHPEPPPPSIPAHAPSLPANMPDMRRLPLAFVPNAGQTDQTVRFQARGLGGMLFFTPQEIVLTLPTAGGLRSDNGRGGFRRAAGPWMALRMSFDGANAAPSIRAAARLQETANFLIGNNAAKWRTNVPTYAGLVYQQIYPGIDLHYDGTNGQIKSTYSVAPGADPTGIRWRYQGAKDVQVDAAGNLVINLPPPNAPVTATTGISGTLTELAPRAWQTIGNRQIPVDAHYAMAADGRVHFVLGAYDHTQPLTIDPTLTYGTFLGGTNLDESTAVALDNAGNIYLTGFTSSTDFPHPNGQALNGGEDAFVTKINPTVSGAASRVYIVPISVGATLMKAMISRSSPTARATAWPISRATRFPPISRILRTPGRAVILASTLMRS